MAEENKSLIQLHSGLLAALSSGVIRIDIMPQEILVLECIVTGTSYRDLTDVEQQLNAEVKLELVREAKNKFDEFAVALHFDKSKIGYLPMEKK